MKTCVAQWNVDQLGAAVVQSSHTCTYTHLAAAWTWLGSLFIPFRIFRPPLLLLRLPAFLSISLPITLIVIWRRLPSAAHLINFTFTRLSSFSPLFCPSMCNLISRALLLSALHSRSDAVPALFCCSFYFFLISNSTSVALTSTRCGIKVVTVAVTHQWSVCPFTELSQNQRNQILLVWAQALSQL